MNVEAWGESVVAAQDCTTQFIGHELETVVLADEIDVAERAYEEVRYFTRANILTVDEPEEV